MANKKQILLVEDERMIALVESNMLKKHGCDVVLAKNGDEAFKAVKSEAIDLILMDIDLGNNAMDGTQAAQTILKDHDIPIVFCTGHSEKEYVDKVKGITRYGYVIKHSGEFVLLQTIDMAFELFEARRNIREQKQAAETANEKLQETICELKRKDGRLEKLNTSLVTVSECNQVLIRSRDEEKLIKDICGTIIEKAGYRFAWVGYVNDGGKKKVEPVARAGCEQGYLDELEIFLETGITMKGPTARAIRTNKTQIISDIQTDTGYKPWRDYALSREYRSMIALPLRIPENESFGVLDIYASEPAAFGKDERNLLEELSGDLSYGIWSLRTAQAHRRNEVLLNKIIENLPVGLQIFDDKGFSFMINHKQKELLGLPDKGDGIGTFNILTDPYSKARGKDTLYRRAYAGETIHNRESESNFGIPGNVWNTRRDRRIFSETIFPIFSRQAKVEYVVSLLTDITDKKKNEERLRASETKYRELFEKAPVGIFLTNSKGEILEVNPALAKSIGANSPQEVKEKIHNLGKDFYAEEGRRREFLRELEKNGRVNNFIIEAIGLNGHRCRLNLDAQVQSRKDDGTLIISGFTTPL